jgi:hypothetical protein
MDNTITPQEISYMIQIAIVTKNISENEAMQLVAQEIKIKGYKIKIN